MEFKSFNLKNLMDHFKGDEEILSEMIDSFFSAFDDLLNPIRESIESKDADQLKLNAHNFRGVMSNFYDEDGQKLAQELEQQGSEASFEKSVEVMGKLENHLVFFLYEMQHFKRNIEASFLNTCETEEEEE